MPDDKTKRHLDKERIDIKDPAEVRNWCKALGCTEIELRNAVDQAGVSAAEVRKFLGK